MLLGAIMDVQNAVVLELELSRLMCVEVCVRVLVKVNAVDGRV